MAENVEKCGTRTIRYPSECSYVCSCPAGGGCFWTVSCNGTVFSGTGLTNPTPQKPPHVTVAGNLEACAKILQEAWKRPVIVPPKLRRRSIRSRTLKGTPEQVAEALGLQLGSRREFKKSKAKPRYNISVKG